MARIPTPRSRNAILGDMISAFLSRFGIKSLKVGAPVLSILQAAAQSDLRSSQDIFDLLNAQSLDRARGLALDRAGADEDVFRLAESPSTGRVVISDSRFTKIESKVFQGAAAPIAGSAVLRLADAAAFPASGEVYIGRGTPNYEGPLTYSSKVNNGTYWTLNLVDNTTRFHNLGESVVLAQGGDRSISANTLIQTPQGNTSTAIVFSTLYQSIIPDGEISISGVQVIAQVPGISGVIPANAIKSFVTPPFPGAVVSNPLPFTNGMPTENDDLYRERIKAVKQSRSKGTALAITTAVQGRVAPDENKRLTSSSVVTRQGYPTTLYIDDGTGYEETSSGLALEKLVDVASGGEQYFQVSRAPVAKAFILSEGIAPFDVAGGARLAVRVGGVVSEHTFDPTDFRAAASASAFEVASAINGDETLNFSASTSDGGTKVRIFAKEDTNEDLEVIEPVGGIDSNDSLLFPSGRVDTMRLYRNDRLLSKDGRLAAVLSNPPSAWGVLSTGETLTIAIDGTAAVTYTFVDQDFVDASTGFSTVAANSLAAWAEVLNRKVPGITAEAVNGRLELTSNAGRRARASIAITGGTLVSTGQMFEAETVVGADNDYTLNRNTGQIRLETALSAGESLTLGSINTRAFLSSGAIAPVTVAAGGARLWFSIDGNAAVVPTGLSGATTLTVSIASTPYWGQRIRITAGSAVFANVRSGDRVIAWDSNLDAAMVGTWSVAQATSTYIEIERSSAATVTPQVFTLAESGLVFVRSNSDIQEVVIPAGANYTAKTFADLLTSQLQSAVAKTYRTSSLRVSTKTFLPGGDIALVAIDSEGSKLDLDVTDAVSNIDSHLASAVSSKQATTPEFTLPRVSAETDEFEFTTTDEQESVLPQNFVVGLRNYDDTYNVATPAYRIGHNVQYVSPVADVSTPAPDEQDVITRLAARERIEWDRFYSASPWLLTPSESFVVVIDKDVATKRYTVPMSRRLTPVGLTFGTSNVFRDGDNADQSLAVAFGLEYSFDDFAVHMRARAKTHLADSTKTVMWRYTRPGPDGNNARITYGYPAAPNTPVGVTENILNGRSSDVVVTLPSGPAKTGFPVRNTTKLGVASAVGPGGLDIVHLGLGFSVSSATRTMRLNFTAQTLNFTPGEVITGAISGTTATIVSQIDSGTSGTLVISGASGNFNPAEIITSAGGSATTAGTQYHFVALSLTYPTTGGGALMDITGHGLVDGNPFWLQSTHPDFPSGLKAMAGGSATVIGYVDTATTLTTVASIGTVSVDPSGETTWAGATPTPIAVGDIVSIASTSSLPATIEGQAMKVSYISGQTIQGYLLSYGGPTTSTPAWSTVGDAPSITAFGIAPATASDIVTAVNALTDAPVSAFVVSGAGTGTIDEATFDEELSASIWESFTDGVNYVFETTAPPTVAGDYTLSFKSPINGDLASDSDWANEDVFLVPVTVKNFVDWLSTLTVTGLSSVASIQAVDQAQRLQISSLLPGGNSGVQVQGGVANSTAAALVGTATLVTDPDTSTYCVATVPTSDAAGLMAGSWVRASNATPLLKSIVTAQTTLAGWTTAGVMTFDDTVPTPLWEYSNAGPVLSRTWQIERQGDFVCFSFDAQSVSSPGTPNIAGVSEGDWVWIRAAATPTANAVPLSSVNAGFFRVVRAQTSDANGRAFWIENPNVLEEVAECDLSFLSFDSVLPGDVLSISTDAWGADNKGLWTVLSVGDVGDTGLSSNQYTNSSAGQHIMKVVSAKTPVAASAPALGSSQFRLVQLSEGQAGSYIKRVVAVTANPVDPEFSDVKFSTDVGAGKLGASVGTVLSSLNKLGFDTDLMIGADAYRYSTGLVAEANRVAYGDKRDPATYPGVVAAGSTLNIAAPLVKRVTVGLVLRIRTGVSTIDVANRVRSAVASVVNRSPIGASIALSDIVTAAGNVRGVAAVVITSPTYSTEFDRISVQPYEKPLVLNLEQDVLVSFAGE